MKRTLTTILMLFTIIATACSTTTKSAANPSSQALSTENKLIIGTIKLDGTAQAVTAEQAAKLLPLWQLRKELSTNSAAAPQEITAVINQIQSDMTSQQMQAIDAMKLTQQDVMAVMQNQGMAQSSRPSGSTSSQGQNSGGGFAPPAGGPGGDPGGGIPGMGPSASTSSTNSTKTSQSASSSNAASSSLIDFMIQFLQKKAGA